MNPIILSNVPLSYLINNYLYVLIYTSTLLKVVLDIEKYDINMYLYVMNATS